MIKKILLVVAIVLISIGSFLIFRDDEKLEKDIHDNTFQEIPYQDELSLQVEEKMKEMSFEEKIAQMIMIQYRDPSSYDQLFDLLERYHFGGFILFNENMDTYQKTKDFVSKLKSYSDIPFIVGMDQEGGSVQRLKYLKGTSVTNIPYMYELGKTRDTELAYQVGKVMAEELRTISVNVVFAPDVDIYSNSKNTVIGKRSFGEDANLVSLMSLALASGLEDNGVIATYKHFPGHGDTTIDSHLELPIISKDYDALKKLELIPFMNAITNNAKMIMIGHIALPEITGNNTPASLSKTLITDILKNDLNYQGLIITDALNMGALTKHYTQEEIVMNAINAGVDILLMPEDVEETIIYIKDHISEERINESVKKILTFKYQYLSSYEDLGEEYLGSKEHKDIILKINK